MLYTCTDSQDLHPDEAQVVFVVMGCITGCTLKASLCHTAHPGVPVVLHQVFDSSAPTELRLWAL